MSHCIFFQSPIGILKITVEDNFITGLSLAPDNSTLQTKSSCKLLEKACEQLDEYFCGKRKSFDLPLKLNGTAFQKQVWTQLLKIPYAETRTYQDIAITVRNPRAYRAVGLANNKNPILILVPCHRVINKDGTLGGFVLGNDIKRKLLDLEKSHLKNCDICK